MAKTEEEEAKTVTTSTDIRSAVEAAGSADESATDEDDEVDENAESEAGDKSEEDDKAEGSEEDESEEDEQSEDEESKDETKGDDADKDKKSEYRYSQYVGDGKPETYISNLEKAYEASSAEGINLNQKLQQATRRVEAIMEAVQSDKELADKLYAALEGNPSSASPKGEAAPTTDPFLVHAKTEWEETSTKEAQEFIDANPEVVSNPQINADVKRWMEVFSNEEYKTKGRLMTAGEAMTKAYKHLGYEDKREARKSLSDVKKAAAPTRPQGSRKPAKTASDFTDSQLDFAGKMGISKEKLDKFGK